MRIALLLLSRKLLAGETQFNLRKSESRDTVTWQNLISLSLEFSWNCFRLVLPTLSKNVSGILVFFHWNTKLQFTMQISSKSLLLQKTLYVVYLLIFQLLNWGLYFRNMEITLWQQIVFENRFTINFITHVVRTSRRVTHTFRCGSHF